MARNYSTYYGISPCNTILRNLSPLSVYKLKLWIHAQIPTQLFN